ncbi:unnamed protein product [Candidula unifasciata]|uniref:G-protein coupled receptors family 1 profile domain-containing protein n=1 Tax=Candidula unifasciata TaxID=100452 RepID=A0A8S3ZYU5_9EUPU|nr:unnamed protein product [Candidula unifasciata]
MYTEQNDSLHLNKTHNFTEVDNFSTGGIYRISYIFSNYYLWVIFAFGFPGNLATVLTICCMRHLKVSFVLYVAILAISDNLAIFIKILYYQLLLNKVPIGAAGCRLLEFLGNFLVTFSPWILVMMAVERLIAVRYPFQVHFLSCLSNKKAFLAVAIVGAIIAVICAPVLWTSTFDNEGRCTKENTTLYRALQLTVVSLYAFLPFIILTVCNFLIAQEIRTSFRLRNSFTSIYNLAFNRRFCDVQRQIMLMLLTSTVMFCLLHFPICLFLLTNHYWDVEEYSASWSVKYLCHQIVYMLSDSNHAINFYLYFFSSRKFRSHFKQMLTGCSLCCCSR